MPEKELLLPHMLHSHFSHWCKHKRKLSSLKGLWGCGYSVTMFPVLFCSTPSLTHAYYTAHCICSHTAAALHFSVTPTLWRVKSEKAQKEFTQDSHGAFSSYTTATPFVSASVSACVTHRRETTPHPTHAHITRHTIPPPLHTRARTHSCTDGAELSPRHASPPMYKPHAAAARRARVQARRQDVKMETDGDSKRERQRQKWRVRDVLTLVFVFIKWIWLKGFRGTILAEDGSEKMKVCVRHNEGKLTAAVPPDYDYLHVWNVNRNRWVFLIDDCQFFCVFKMQKKMYVVLKTLLFPVC